MVDTYGNLLIEEKLNLLEDYSYHINLQKSENNIKELRIIFLWVLNK